MAHKNNQGSSIAQESRSGQACLDRTRTAVLNVLVAIGLVIAVTGAVLRFRADQDGPLRSRSLRQPLLGGLIVIAVISYAARRILSQRIAGGQTGATESLFFWSHLLPALIAAAAAPLGLVYGWWVDSRLQSVIPFWVVSLALGSLALPRASELECFDRSAPR